MTLLIFLKLMFFQAISTFIHNPDFAPLMQSNLSGLPPALVVTCEFDVLRDEGAIYAHRLRAAHVEVGIEC
jgi:acetyl esterase/lipase